jgi:methylated-DNA-[protein]-cysteine S-methyltransferase
MNPRTKTEKGVTACQTAFGWVGIAWSDQGLVAVTLPQPTEAEVMSGLPAARGLDPDQAPGLDLEILTDKLQRYFDGEAIVFDEPLDPTIGTRFQQRVWAITRAIPRGQTRTYGQIAREAGSPGAARAVGQAMARNPWPVIVPCHRVVGHDGGLTGFGGGLGMKRQMLTMEGTNRELSASSQPPLFSG